MYEANLKKRLKYQARHMPAVIIYGNAERYQQILFLFIRRIYPVVFSIKYTL